MWKLNIAIAMLLIAGMMFVLAWYFPEDQKGVAVVFIVLEFLGLGFLYGFLSANLKKKSQKGEKQ